MRFGFGHVSNVYLQFYGQKAHSEEKQCQCQEYKPAHEIRNLARSFAVRKLEVRK